MFLGRRSAQAEYFDLRDRPVSEIVNDYRDLDRINRFCQFARPFKEKLPYWLGEDRCAQLDILDVGAGTGLLAQTLSRWAADRGWTWRFTNLEANALAPHSDPSAGRVLGSALQLPFPDGHFDLVIASQMTHHLTDDQIVVHLQEAWRVTRDAVMISDMHRNRGLHALLWLTMLILRVSPTVRSDGLTSVRRGFHCAELRQFAERAKLGGAIVKVYYGARILLFARKLKQALNAERL